MAAGQVGWLWFLWVGYFWQFPMFFPRLLFLFLHWNSSLLTVRTAATRSYFFLRIPGQLFTIPPLIRALFQWYKMREFDLVKWNDTCIERDGAKPNLRFKTMITIAVNSQRVLRHKTAWFCRPLCFSSGHRTYLVAEQRKGIEFCQWFEEQKSQLLILSSKWRLS